MFYNDYFGFGENERQGEYLCLCIVGDLSFKNFNSVGYSHLVLSIDGGATTAATDDKKKTICLPASIATFTGGSYDGYAFGWNSDAAEAELSLFLGRFFSLFE